MTIPKDPAMPHEELQNNSQPGLGESINELEQLIDDAKNAAVNNDNIPVLDELVMPDDRDSSEHADNQFTTVKMSELANTIDEKLADELNALLDILKDTIKHSIIDEITTRLNTTDKYKNYPPKDNPD